MVLVVLGSVVLLLLRVLIFELSDGVGCFGICSCSSTLFVDV